MVLVISKIQPRVRKMFSRAVVAFSQNNLFFQIYIPIFFFSVLDDTRDREGAQITYVVQENIEVIKSAKVLHPKVDDHFEAYDGSQYIPRPWLRELYPLD